MASSQKIILNADGSVKLTILDNYIQQGNDGVDDIYIGVVALPSSVSGVANFELPNGDVNTLSGIYQAQISDGQGSSYAGFKFTLKQAQTLYEGNVKMSLQLTDTNSNVLYSYASLLTINPAVMTPSEQKISQAQWNSLISSLASYQLQFSNTNVRGYQSLAQAQADIPNLAVNQVVIYKTGTNWTIGVSNGTVITTLIVVSENYLSLDGGTLTKGGFKVGDDQWGNELISSPVNRSILVNDVTGDDLIEIFSSGELGVHNVVNPTADKDASNKKYVDSEIAKVVDGTTQVGKAVQDQNGDVINTTYQKVAEKGIAGGYAPLNASGKVPDSYLPSDTSKFYAGTITSGVCTVNQAFITKFGVPTLTISANDINTYDGAYFVATNNFTIASGNAGIAITLTSGDELISHGSVGYAKIDSNNDVVSVNGQTGAVAIRFDNYNGEISSITPTIASGLNTGTRYMTSDSYEFRVRRPYFNSVLLLYEIADKKVVVVKTGTISTDTWDDDPQYKKKLVGEVEFTSSKTLEEAIKFIAHKDLQGDIYTVETTDYGNVFVFNEEESGTTTQYSLLANGYVYKVNYDTATDTYEIISYSTLISITHADLLAKVNAGTLIAGQQYRITDYTCSTSTIDTQSAGHQFDIIVKADSINKLNENARAILHDGDTYFANTKISAWKLRYSIANDTSRFAWADEANGKGVIYWMKDEFNNDCPYDFKNIQFKRKLTNGVLDLVGGVDTWVYTFTLTDLTNSDIVDISLKQNTEYQDDEGQYWNCSFNTIKEAILDYEPDGLIRLKLNDNVFLNVFDNNDTYLYYGCYSNTFGNYCYSNTFGTNCFNNTFGTGCYNNTFGTNCYSNTFGNSCFNNTFGTKCYSNAFGTYCSRNTFGTTCYNNAFGTKCYSNTFGASCSRNTFGTECSGNAFGTYCSRNTFGTTCYNNAFGTTCYNNAFGTGCNNNTFGIECNNNTFGNSCQYDKITGNSVRYLNIDNGIQGASAANKLELYDSGAIANNEYQISFKKSASGRYLMLWATDTGTMTGKYKALNTDAIWTAL